jgi:ABC-2 type transport system permease protein
MKNLMWLIKREYWENKNLYVKAPAIVGVLMILFVCAVTFISIRQTIHVDLPKVGNITGVTISALKQEGVVQSIGLVNRGITIFYLGFTSILLLICIVVSYSYLGSALLSDRMDKSILFWKSLPISDTTTVFSKLAFPLVIGPSIAILFAAIGFLCVVIFFVIVGLIYEIPVLNLYAQNATVFLQPLKMLALLPVYFLWALPCAAWVLMVSAWTKSRALVWAFGVPLLIMVAISFLAKSFELDYRVMRWSSESFAHLVFGLFPLEWIMPAVMEMRTPQQVSDLWLVGLKTLSGWKIWAGAAVGVAMLYATVQLRRHRTEV